MADQMRIPFGTMPDGTLVEQITLSAGALECDVITYGGALRAFRVPDRSGTAVDILLGFDTLEDYRTQDKYMGALIGRCANRIGGAGFELNEVRYPLCANNGVNHLHGGVVGFDKQVWMVEKCGRDSLTLSLESPDGQEGYPGALSVQVEYRLGKDGLSISYRAVSTQDTVCNLTNHAYFNLAGHQSGNIGQQQIQILADCYTPANAQSIPDGTLADVTGTPMDLRQMTAIGAHIDDGFEQLVWAGGYDHNWELRGGETALRLAARAYCPVTGIKLEVLTTKPGIQFYTGNYLDGCPRGKAGAPYAKRWGFCLETQYYPDAVHHANFPSPVLRAGTRYEHKTVYRIFTDCV